MESLTLEQIYYIGELIGVFALITSLIYVGKQLQQNTEQMRTNAAIINAQWVSSIQSSLLNNRESAECWVKGGTDFNNMDAVDQQRIIQFEVGAFTMIAEQFDLWQQKLLPEERWQFQSHYLKHIGQRQSIREAWKIAKDGFPKPFQDWMGQYVE